MKVLFTIPNGNGLMHKECHMAAIKIMGDGRYKVDHSCPTLAPYAHNLNTCVQAVLDGGYDYWLTFDDDNPPLYNPLDRVGDNLDVCGFPTLVWNQRENPPFYFNAFIEHEDKYKPWPTCEGLQEVDAIGSGCMLIARRVLEALQDNQPFCRIWDDKGLVELGGDLNFCRKARAAGYRIWADYERPCEHWKHIPIMNAIDLVGKYAQRREMTCV